MAKTLIAFYSHAGENYVNGGVRFLKRGNNEVIVDKIKAALPDADVFRIETVKKYKEDYYELIDEAKQELRAGGRHTWRLQMNSQLRKIDGVWKITLSKASTY